MGASVALVNILTSVAIASESGLIVVHRAATGASEAAELVGALSQWGANVRSILTLVNIVADCSVTAETGLTSAAE